MEIKDVMSESEDIDVVEALPLQPDHRLRHPGSPGRSQSHQALRKGTEQSPSRITETSELEDDELDAALAEEDETQIQCEVPEEAPPGLYTMTYSRTFSTMTKDGAAGSGHDLSQTLDASRARRPATSIQADQLMDAERARRGSVQSFASVKSIPGPKRVKFTRDTIKDKLKQKDLEPARKQKRSQVALAAMASQGQSRSQNAGTATRVGQAHVRRASQISTISNISMSTTSKQRAPQASAKACSNIEKSNRSTSPKAGRQSKYNAGGSGRGTPTAQRIYNTSQYGAGQCCHLNKYN